MPSAVTAGEAALDEATRRRMRRQPPLLIGLCNVLVLAVGATAVVDLRRLQTPAGTSLAWTEAALFGDCGDYLKYSIADPSVPKRLSHDELCTQLRVRTKENRANSAGIGLRRKDVQTRGGAAIVELALTRLKVSSTVTLHLRKVGGRWKVLRDKTTCAVVGCS